MKNYNEMTEDVLRRIAEEKAIQKKRKKTAIRIAVPAVCACVCLLGGVGIYHNFNTPAIFNKEPNKSGVYVPEIKLEHSEYSSDSLAYAILVYNGAVYTNSDYFNYGNKNTAFDLIGDYIGEAVDSYDSCFFHKTYEELSKTEFASSFSGKVYSVKGYSKDFLICIVSDYTNENNETVQDVYFMEKLNGIKLDTGKDLFGKRFNIKENTVSVSYQIHDDWNNGKKIFKPISLDDDFMKFIDELYSGKFEYTYETNKDIYDISKQAHIYITLKDGITIELRLIKGGYVGYQKMGWYFVKVEDEAFEKIFEKCV